MIAPHPARPAPVPRGLIAPPEHYCPIPQRLLADLHDTPIAIGLYALVARLYLIEQAPVPLSRADVQRYDPSLKTGAVKRALDRLLNRGWLIAAPTECQRKQRYTPSWGRIKGAPLPWQMGQSCLGRPRHIIRQLLDRSLLDVCMGRIIPHATQSATISRYVTTPALGLADIGSYALALAGQPRETEGLQRLGLVRAGQALPVPAEPRLLALISQRALLDDAEDVALTVGGTRRLGVGPAPEKADRSQPLFFVPPGSIGSLIGQLIGESIGSTNESAQGFTVLQRAKTHLSEHVEGITWDSWDSRNQATPPPTPSNPTTTNGGGTQEFDQKEHAHQSDSQPGTSQLPETPATRLLQSINVLPAIQFELAGMPAETVSAAIAHARAHPQVRDLAGWVVKLLRTHRDHGWQIAPPTPRAETPEDLRLAFARYAAAQEAARRAGMPEDTPWFPPEPAKLNLPGVLPHLWNDVQAALKAQLPRAEFAMIRHAALLSVEQGVATIQAPSQTVKAALENRHLSVLRDLLALFAGEQLQVRVVLNPHASSATMAAPAPEALPDMVCPTWVTAERWALLPTLLRATLAGAAFVDGAVRGRDAFCSRKLETIYRREVDDLITAAQVAEPDTLEAMLSG